MISVIFLIPNIYAQSESVTPGSEKAPEIEKAPQAERTTDAEKVPQAESAPEIERASGAEKAPESKPYSGAESISPSSSNPSSGGCLIATAIYGSELAPQVQLLRELRDNTVLTTTSGTSFMTAFNAFYYSYSPVVADLERQNPMFKEMVKVAITPLLSSLSLLQYVDIDSEAEMLGYGIGVILLNIGMYFVAPIVAIVKIGKLSKK